MLYNTNIGGTRAMENNEKEIGKKLRKLREYMGLTQEQVAEILNLGRDAIIRIEKGTRKINLEELMKFSKLYKISIDSIINSGDNKFESITALARGFEKLTENDRKEILDLIELKNNLKSNK